MAIKKFATMSGDLQTVKDSINFQAVKGANKEEMMEALKNATYMDPELSTFEEGEVCDLKGSKIEDLVDACGVLEINGNDAYYLLLPFEKDGNTTIKRLFTGSLKKRVQEVDMTTGKNGNVVKSSTFNMFRGCGSQLEMLKKLVNTKITCNGHVEASMPVRDASGNLTGTTRPTSVYNWTIE